ncbi:hypothetical protein M9H77_19826 [Catharanthus roseus]|uniref:Uncharacterized protein n=1 Tax=Catharanthus roseus TaxID=4058 RepID=A0ACC0BBI5_CATRO|nr:hypothetical protein M9H77_19826 [Catharanthus roseus]
MTGRRNKNNSSPIGSPLSGDSSSNNNKDQDRFLPIANVSRIMKKSLPSNAKISKEAKETVQECVSEFISFITGEASDKCQREKRKTINGDDLLWAMTTLGFENYVVSLKVYLNKYRENEGEKTSMARDHQDDQDSTPADFHSRKNGYYYSLEGANNYGDPAGRSVFGYGNNIIPAGVFNNNIGKNISEIEGTANRVIATNLSPWG